VSDFETIFKYTGTGLAVLDEDGTFLSVNPALAQFLLLPEKELLEKTLMEVIHNDDLNILVNKFKELAVGNTSSFILESRFRANDHYTWGLLTLIKTDDENYIAEVQDITRVRAIQEELRNFAYAASHDLREPLRIINGYAYMLQSAMQALPPTFRHYVGNMVEAATRMSEMIDGLLAYSRVNQELDYTRISIVGSLRQAKKNLKNKIDASGAIIKCKGKAHIKGIKGQWIQLFQNLLDNAIKYSKEGEKPLISIKIVASDTYVKVTLSDKGIGIDEKNHKKMFKIFKQLHPKETYVGRGIGLALVRQIVDHHHGKVWIESEVGEGTTFHISLPVLGE
jgi:PAS domain S-box-containing protein